MEDQGILAKIPIKISHLPTAMLVIGYAAYWLELYVLKAQQGVTSPLAVILFCLVGVVVVRNQRQAIFSSLAEIRSQLATADLFAKFFMGLGSLFVLVIFACAFYAAVLPPHLSQEADALNYHLAVARQHLILNSFQLVPWSTCDLFLLPLNFALAPYWFATVLPNKFPQLLFLVGLTLIAVNFVRALGKVHIVSSFLMVFAIFGSHNFGIQMGTAMLDLVVCYLFLAALDSLMAGQRSMAVVEFTFFLWSKSFVPIQVAAMAAGLWLLYWILTRRGFQLVTWLLAASGHLRQDTRPTRSERSARRSGKWLIGFAVLSLLIGGPFMAKALYYSGTPFFPMAPGFFMINKNIDTTSSHWQSILEASDFLLGPGKDGYGHGRSFIAFLRHLWLIAVPEDQVNNAYDYPVGLVYLLFLGPFLYQLGASLKKKELAIIPWLIAGYWTTWWFGSQQTRFLYIPLVLMFISVIVWMQAPSKILMAMLLLALSFNTISMVRAHKDDWGLSPQEVLRKKDLALVLLSQAYIKEARTDFVWLDEYELAYAQFPVIATKKKVPFTLTMEEK